MARYANHECAGCGRILPAYELTEVSDRVETGVSRHEHRIGHSPHFRHTGTTRRYANRIKRLCARCRVSRFVGKVVTLGGGGLLFLAFASHGDGGSGSGGTAAPTASTSGLLDRATDLASQAGSAVSTAAAPVLTEASTAEDAAAEREAASTQPANQPAVPDERAALAERVISAPETVEQVEEAVQRALEQGKAVRWKVHKLRGYAVPSEAASNGCRMIQVSIDHSAQGAPFQRCPAAGEGEQL